MSESPNIRPDFYTLGANSTQKNTGQSTSPLDLLKPRPSDLLQCYIPQFSEKVKLISDNRFIIIHCQLSEALLDLKFQIEEELGEGCSSVLYSNNNRFENGNSVSIQDIYQWQLADTVDLRRPKEKPRQVTYVHVTDEGLIQSLKEFVAMPEFPEHRNELRRHNAILVCLIFNKDFAVRNSDWQPEYFWSVPWIDILLATKTKDKNLVKELSEQIVTQHKKALWKLNPSQFYKEASKFLRSGLDSFKEELTRREELEHYVSEFKGDELLQCNVVTKAMLFTASHFEGLSHALFQKIMSILLEGEFVEKKQRFKKTLSNGEVQIGTESFQEDALQYWQKHKIAIFKKFDLRSWKDEKNSLYLDFPSVADRDQIRNEFQKTQLDYPYKQFNKLYKSGILFAPQTPSVLVNQLNKIACQMAEAYPDSFEASWLHKTVIEGELIASIEELVVFVRANQRVFYPRFGELCAQLLSVEGTRKIVTNLIQQLFDDANAHHEVEVAEQAFEIAQKVIHRLRFTKEFSYYFWVKKFFNNGSAPIKSSTLFQLSHYAMGGISKFDEVTNELKSWHPSPETEELSKLHQYSLGFLITYLHLATERFDARSISRVVPEHPFFPRIANQNQNDVDKRLELLVAWLMNPKLWDSYSTVCEDFDKKGWTFQMGLFRESKIFQYRKLLLTAEFIEEFYRMDLALAKINEQSGVCIEVDITTKNLIEQMLGRAEEWGQKKDEVRNALNRIWWSKGKDYLDIYHNAKNRINRNVCVKKRQRVADLRELVNSVSSK